MESTSSPLTGEQKRLIRDALRQPRRIIPFPFITVRRLTINERTARVRRAYPGLTRAACARLIRRKGDVVFETQVRWDHPIPRPAPGELLGGFVIPEDVQIGAKRMEAQAAIGMAFGMPARLLAPTGEQNAPAQRELLGLPVRVVDDFKLRGVQ